MFTVQPHSREYCAQHTFRQIIKENKPGNIKYAANAIDCLIDVLKSSFSTANIEIGLVGGANVLR